MFIPPLTTQSAAVATALLHPNAPNSFMNPATKLVPAKPASALPVLAALLVEPFHGATGTTCNHTTLLPCTGLLFPLSCTDLLKPPMHPFHLTRPLHACWSPIWRWQQMTPLPVCVVRQP